MRSFVTIAVVMMAGVAVAMADGYGSSGYGSSYMSYPGYGGYSSGYGSGYGYGGGYGSGYGYGSIGGGSGKGYGKKHHQSTAVYYPVPVPVQQPSPAPLPLPPIGLDAGIDAGNNGIFGGNGGLGLIALLFLIPLLFNNNNTSG